MAIIEFMLSIGIRNLRNSLSRYLNLVKEGEQIIITDHNKVIARIIPAGEDDREHVLKEYLEDQIHSGGIEEAQSMMVLEKNRTLQSDPSILESIYQESREERI